MRLPAIFALAAATLMSAPAIASDGETNALIDFAQQRAAWSGVEVERIIPHGDRVLIEGKNRLGEQVVINESCAKAGVDCATYAARRTERPQTVDHAGAHRDHS